VAAEPSASPPVVGEGGAPRLAVFLSGGGTTLLNLVSRIEEGRLKAAIAGVLASRPCLGLDRARGLGLRCELVDRKSCRSVEEFSDKLFACCRSWRADLVALSGFLDLVRIPPDFEGRVLNIHPSLIPSFCGKGYYGRHVHEAVLARGVKISGCTVHFADNEFDHGPIILQRAVPVLDDDTPERLAARVFAAECEAYPEAIALFFAGRLQIEGRRVRIRGAPDGTAPPAGA